MDNHLTLTGMVLSAMPVGEYDKRISLLTREQGKISAFVRGARRPKSPLLAAANPMSFGTFFAYEGRDSYTIQKADITEHFEKVRSDIDLILYATYFMEVADYYGREGMDETERLKLLYAGLRALEKGQVDMDLVRLVYDLKTLTINGEEPNVFECLSCGKKEDISFFSMYHRGTICRDCYSKEGGEKLQQSVLYALQYIITTPEEKLFSFRLSDDAKEQLKDLLIRYQNRYVDHTFKSERFLTE